MACKEPAAGRNTQQPIQSKRSCKEQIPCAIPETDCNQSCSSLIKKRTSYGGNSRGPSCNIF